MADVAFDDGDFYGLAIQLQNKQSPTAESYKKVRLSSHRSRNQDQVRPASRCDAEIPG